MVTDIVSFVTECRQLREGQGKRACLKSYEPELCVTIEPRDRLGHLLVRVEITPDHMMQHHVMDFEFDQTYLPEIIRQCRAIVDEYPVRGKMPEKDDA